MYFNFIVNLSRSLFYTVINQIEKRKHDFGFGFGPRLMINKIFSNYLFFINYENHLKLTFLDWLNQAARIKSMEIVNE